MLIARSRELVPRNITQRSWHPSLRSLAKVIYRRPTPRLHSSKVIQDDVEQAIVDIAKANQTDGYRMVCTMPSRQLGRPVNRKCVLQVMRKRGLIQRKRCPAAGLRGGSLLRGRTTSSTWT